MKTFGSHNYYVYILTNRNKTVLYVGVTNDLKIRIYQHNHQEVNSKSFTTKYKCFYLVYYEHFLIIDDAIAREKQIKGWSRSKKNQLITKFNENWIFLNNDI